MFALVADHWLWLVAGILLVALEALVPGIYFLWIGVAAIATGLITFVLPLPLPMQLVVASVLGIASIYVGNLIQKRQKDEVTDSPFLHERGKAMIGKVFVLEQAISQGAGAVRVGDSVWRVTGPDIDAGARVRVTGIDGGTLMVEAA
jgi:inner membrane protein